MTCKEIESLLAPGADGTLNNTQHRQLTNHLAACDKCRDLLKEQTEIRTLLSERPHSPVPFGFSARLVGTLNTEATIGWSTWIDALNWRTWTFRLAAIAGSLLLAAILGSGRSDSAEVTTAVDFSELVTAWISSGGNAASDGTLDAVASLWTDKETDDVLLDILLTAKTETTF